MSAFDAKRPPPPHVELVREFFVAAGQPVPAGPLEPAAHPTLRAERLALLREESEELTNALDRRDRREAAGELCDVLYVAIGSAVAFGWTLPERAPDAVSVPAATPVAEFALVTARGAAAGIEAAVEAFGEAADAAAAIDALARVAAGARWVAELMRLDLDPLFREVHRANLTKTCANEEEAVATVAARRSARYPAPTYRRVLGHYVVSSGGKMLKSIKWTPPRLAALLD